MRRLAGVLLAVALLAAGGARAQVPDQINVFIPAFEAEGALGQNAATVLNLRVWSTLRSKPWPENPDNLDFGRGLIIWDPNPLAEGSHASAEAAAMAFGNLAQMTLWGKAYSYGDDVVIQANMSIPEYRDYRDHDLETWKVVYRDRTVTADIPRRRFEVSSIVLDRTFVESYSLPSSLAIYPRRSGGEPVGRVGTAFRAIQFEPDLALVIADGMRGWVRLPRLSDQPTEVSSFVGGVIRTFRGDWQGALDLMARVIENSNTRTPLRIDAHLYSGMALERMGQSGREHFQAALELNRYAARTVRYLAMSHLSELARLDGNPDAMQSARQRLETLIADNEKLFAADDPWLIGIKAALE